MDSNELSLALVSERIFLYGADKQNNPWFYFKPFEKFGKYFPRKQEVSMQDYMNYIMYCFETLGDILIRTGYNTTFTMIVDWSGKRIDSKIASNYFDTIWKLIKDHYPQKLTWIHLLNVKLK